MGADVYAITRSESKVQELLDSGCADVVISTDAEQMKKYARTFDIIIDTISNPHNLNELLGLIKPKGQFGLVGGCPSELGVQPFAIVGTAINMFGSLIGTIENTQAILDLCAEHKICVPVEVIKPDYINDAYERVLKSDVKYRFVIDIDELRK